jgi:MFS family permease
MSEKIVRVYFIIRFFLGVSISFFFATYSLFLVDAGLNLFEVNLVNACFMISCFFLEVPTGAVADVYGRKVSFLFSCLILSLSFLMYYFSSTIVFFIVAEIVGAVGHTLYSGAFKSWMIDEVHSTGENFDITRAYRGGKIWNGLGVMVGVIAGAYLGGIDLAWPWLCSAIFTAFTGVLGWALIKESRPVKKKKPTHNFQELWQSIGAGYLVCMSNSRIMFAIGLGFFFGFACAAPNMYWPLRYEALGINTGLLGFVHFGTMAVIILGVFLSKEIFGALKCNEKALLFTVAIFALGIFLAGHSQVLWVSLPMFYVHELARGFYEPLLDDYLNKEIKAETRATIQSFQCMISTLGMGLGLAVSGWVAERFSISASWQFSALVILSVFVLSAIKAKR